MSGKKKTKIIHFNDRITESILNGTKLVMYGVILFFGMANVVLSQNIPAVFFDFAQGKKEAIIDIFVRAKDTHQMQLLFPEVEQILVKYSPEVEKESIRRKTQMQKLTNLLQTNPHAPEILYSLYLLYQAEKDTGQANIYLQQARMYDPQIGR